jgi:hypothetical protein
MCRVQPLLGGSLPAVLLAVQEVDAVLELAFGTGEALPFGLAGEETLLVGLEMLWIATTVLWGRHGFRRVLGCQDAIRPGHIKAAFAVEDLHVERGLWRAASCGGVRRDDLSASGP